MKITVPPISQRLVDDVGCPNKIWYDKLKLIEQLQPLSDIPPAPANVSSIDTATGAITLGYGIARTLQALRASLTVITASLSADVALNNTANYFDGPRVAQGTIGTWFVFGTVTVQDATNAPATINCKLWDGATIISSTQMRMANAAGGWPIPLSGIITSPAGDLRMSCNEPGFTTGKILFNGSGNSKDSTITAVRIA